MLSVGKAVGPLNSDNTDIIPRCSVQISYLSSTDKAYRYLENEQRKIYEGNPAIVDFYSRDELNNPKAVASFAELKKRALRACPDPATRKTCMLDPDVVDKLMEELPCLSLPTRFESPIFFYLINVITKELDIVRSTHFPKSSAARFGSLPTGTIGARALLPRGSEDPIVILNRDIFFFTGSLSKSISDAIPISQGKAVSLDYSEQGIRKRLQEHPYIVANFADAMVRIVRGGTSVGAIEFTLDEDHNHIHARLVSAMDQFLIAHEEAHVILGHVSKEAVEFRLAGEHAPNKSKLRPSLRKADGKSRRTSRSGQRTTTILKEQLRTREQELQADALGFKLMMWSEMNGDDSIAQMMAAAAPHIVFRIMDFADAYGREAGGWDFSDGNHPPAAVRIKSLSPVFEELTKNNKILREVDFRIPFDAALKVLLAEADPLIRQNLGLLAKPGRKQSR